MAQPQEDPNSFRAPAEKIRDHDWQLMPGCYKPVRAAKHGPTDWILADVLTLEDEIDEISTRAKAQQSMLKLSPK